MKHDPIAPPPSSTDDSSGNGPHWTARKMVEFLRALAATHSVTEAVRSVGMSRQSAYQLRSRQKGKAFDKAWDLAFSQSYGNLPYAALDRAMNGVEVQHYYKGEVIGTTRRYDERLTVALLRMISGPNGLAVSLPPGVAAQLGGRFEALLREIEAEGEDAVDPAEEEAFDALSAADSANLSPAAKRQIMAEFRHSRPRSGE
jgi:hypothetical protein